LAYLFAPVFANFGGKGHADRRGIRHFKLNAAIAATDDFAVERASAEAHNRGTFRAITGLDFNGFCVHLATPCNREKVKKNKARWVFPAGLKGLGCFLALDQHAAIHQNHRTKFGFAFRFDGFFGAGQHGL
jgi:hypothetical protein